MAAGNPLESHFLNELAHSVQQYMVFRIFWVKEFKFDENLMTWHIFDI